MLGKRWTLLILEEALAGTSRYVEFQERLNLDPGTLNTRLTMLVDRGILRREPHHYPGQRTRSSYQLTDAGREVHLVLAALQQWSDIHMAGNDDRIVERHAINTNRPVRVAFLDDQGCEVPVDEVVAIVA